MYHFSAKKGIPTAFCPIRGNLRTTTRPFSRRETSRHNRRSTSLSQLLLIRRCLVLSTPVPGSKHGESVEGRRLPSGRPRNARREFHQKACLVVFSQWEISILSTGQNEIERYKEKHVETAVAIGRYAADAGARGGHNFDAA